ncbi:lantibiotic dehydratase [Streptomyces mirabilis]|uniref:lantibiotic dehydratase n=1 Tax=Streptomyces mirabilis TaxID=68239 RepID=UPI0036988F1A
MEIATGARPELLAPIAINFLWNNCTAPMARFLGEISRATAPLVTWFDRGAAWTLPFTPALTYRRTVLTVARWKVRSRALPGPTPRLAGPVAGAGAGAARRGRPAAPPRPHQRRPPGSPGDGAARHRAR